VDPCILDLRRIARPQNWLLTATGNQSNQWCLPHTFPDSYYCTIFWSFVHVAYCWYKDVFGVPQCSPYWLINQHNQGQRGGLTELTQVMRINKDLRNLTGYEARMSRWPGPAGNYLFFLGKAWWMMGWYIRLYCTLTFCSLSNWHG
jgi:hypothetical protein